jgi:plastocyanin
VNFIVSGFHWPWVYNAGVTLAQVKANIPATGTFVNYDVNVFAKGVFPGTPPTFADIAPANPTLSAAQNRTDSFGFSTPGKYLVICNVRGHFIDGMYAWINVVDDDDN